VSNSEGAEVVAATREDSSPSIMELWPDIDKLDDPPREDTFVAHAHNALIRGKRSAASIENASKRSRHEGGSMRREATQILSAAPGAISSRM
jgi:hypothetical protein